MLVYSVRSAWGQWKRPWNSWINQTRVCLTRSSSSTLAHAYWKLETESQSALKPTVTPNMSKYGEGKRIRCCLCEVNHHAHLCYSANDYFVPFFWQKPLDICVEVYRVWRKEASQALQNGTEEAIARGRGKLFLAVNTLVYQVVGSEHDLLYTNDTEHILSHFPEGAEEEGGSCREGKIFQTRALWFQSRLHGYSAILQICISHESARLPRTPQGTVQRG